jgi:hypothetical protein
MPESQRKRVGARPQSARPHREQSRICNLQTLLVRPWFESHPHCQISISSFAQNKKFYRGNIGQYVVERGMKLSLYRRHRRDCKAAHPEEFQFREFDERKKGWKRCMPGIYFGNSRRLLPPPKHRTMGVAFCLVTGSLQQLDGRTAIFVGRKGHAPDVGEQGRVGADSIFSRLRDFLSHNRTR